MIYVSWIVNDILDGQLVDEPYTLVLKDVGILMPVVGHGGVNIFPQSLNGIPFPEQGMCRRLSKADSLAYKFSKPRVSPVVATPCDCRYHTTVQRNVNMLSSEQLALPKECVPWSFTPKGPH